MQNVDTSGTSEPTSQVAALGLVASVSAVLYARMSWMEHASDRNCFSRVHRKTYENYMNTIFYIRTF